MRDFKIDHYELEGVFVTLFENGKVKDHFLVKTLKSAKEYVNRWMGYPMEGR